jgi:hypothetical protein
MQQALLVVVPLLIAIVTVVFGLLHSFARVWFDYRSKLAFLEKLEKHPELVESPSQIQAVLAAPVDKQRETGRQDFALTGGLLLVIGVLCVILGRTMRVGEVAVGLYLGGFLCVPLGILMGAAGLLIRSFSKGPGKLAATPSPDQTE